MAKTDVYQQVTDRIIAELEKGAAPWVKPWDGDPTPLDMPRNAQGKTYNGINVPLLWIAAHHAGYNCPQWMTYKQAAEKGGQVRKGEKGTQIVFFKQLDISEQDAVTGEESRKRVPMARIYTVFNVEQIDGIEYQAPPAPVKRQHERDSLVLPICHALGADVRHGGDQAYFIPSADHIQMPIMENFHSVDGYDATLAHETTHWTGHKSRLDRDFSGRFGDDQYAAEELVAELGAAFICAEFGIVNEELRHGGYIEHWLRVLHSDKRAIFTASSKARQAVEFMKSSLLTDQQEAA